MEPRRLLSLGINLLLSFAIAALFLWLAFRNVSLGELKEALLAFDQRWLIPAVAVSLLLMILRAWRWQMELRPLEHVPLGRLWVVTALAYAAINLLPIRMGEVVRPWLLSRRSGVSASNVIGNLVVEKLMDSFSILFFILLGLLTAHDLPDWVRRGAVFPAGFAALFAALVALVWFRGESFMGRVGRLLPERVAVFVGRVVGAIVAGMRILPDGRLLVSVFALSLLLWSLPILSSWILLQGFQLEVPFNAALIVFIFIGFGTALPNAPGMIGTFQYACILALGLFGVGQTQALAFGLLLNALQVLTILAQGLVALPLALLHRPEPAGNLNSR